MLTFIKNWTLPVAMILGVVAYPFFIRFSFLTPLLIFIMLLFTFCKVSPAEIKITRLHVWLILMQTIGSVVVYLILCRFNKIIAEGAMVCLICPTATAAVVITSKLGGSESSVTTYTIISNIGTALVVPILFPLIENTTGVSFRFAFISILQRVFFLLICPFIAAWLLRILVPTVHRKLLSWHEVPFYLWALSLAIVTSQTFYAIINGTSNGFIEIMVVFVALLLSCLQLWLGKSIGGVYNDRIAGGQSFGQKNTILGIWMSQTYLNPLSSLAPGSYVIWQNIINSWQLWKKRKREEKM